MIKCPLCKVECTITPSKWSGGRNTIECNSCGSIEVSENNFHKILSYDVDGWQMNYLRDGINEVSGRKVISENPAGVLCVKPLAAKLTKMEKKALRRRAEGKSQIIGSIFHIYKSDE